MNPTANVIRTLVLFASVIPTSIPPLSAAAAKAPSTQIPPDAKVFIDRNCTGCHRPATPPAGIDLTTITFDLDNVDTFGRWVRIHDAVRDGKMPPGSSTAIKQPDREAFLHAIADPMIAHEHMHAATQGRAVMRRLNRYEYENTVRDLLGAPWLQLRDALPEDGLVHRFNKSGQALDVSHVQMARYMDAAEQAIRLVLSAANQPESRSVIMHATRSDLSDACVMVPSITIRNAR